MSNHGPIHKLIVREVGEPYGPLSTDDFADYEIEHPTECKAEDVRDGDGQLMYVQYRCGVAQNAEACGVRWSLHYTGTPVNEPGEYPIQAWAETYRGFEYTEYDCGIAVVDPEDNIERSAE